MRCAALWSLVLHFFIHIFLSIFLILFLYIVFMSSLIYYIYCCKLSSLNERKLKDVCKKQNNNAAIGTSSLPLGLPLKTDHF